jgi:hypothetical protein
MPDLPRPARLSLHDAIGYIADRCKCDLVQAGKAVLAALGEERLSASANVLVSDRSYEAGIVYGPIPVGRPKRIDAGIQTVPSKVWADYPWPSFQIRALHPRGNPQYRQHTVDGGQIGPVYVNPTLATADIDRWLDNADEQPRRAGAAASDKAPSSHFSPPSEQPADRGQPKPIRRHASTKRTGGRPEIYGEAKQQVFTSLNAVKALHGLAWFDGKRLSEIDALLRDAVKTPLPGRTRLHEWIRDWRDEQSDSPNICPVHR